MNKNVLITFLSRIPVKVDTPYLYQVQSECDEPVEGCFANEPVLRYVTRLLEKKGEKLDKIVALVTLEDLSGPICVLGKKYDSTLDYYTKLCDPATSLIPVGIQEGEKEREASVIVEELISELDEDNLFIDLSGGMRTFSMYLMLLSSYLEFGRSVIQMTLVAELKTLDNQRKKASLRIETDSGIIMGLLRGMQVFATTGNAGLLTQSLKRSSTRETQRLAKHLQEYSDKACMNRTDGMDQLVKELYADMEANWQSENITDTLIQKLLPMMRKKMHLDADANKLYLSVIAWNVENGMIMQALALYNELIPVYYAQKGYFRIEDGYREVIQRNKGKNKGKNEDTLRFQESVLKADQVAMQDYLEATMTREEKTGEKRYWYFDLRIGQVGIKREQFLKEHVVGAALQNVLQKQADRFLKDLKQICTKKGDRQSCLWADRELVISLQKTSPVPDGMGEYNFKIPKYLMDNTIRSFVRWFSDTMNCEKWYRISRDLQEYHKQNFSFNTDEAFVRLIFDYKAVRALRNHVVHLNADENVRENNPLLCEMFDEFDSYNPEKYQRFLSGCLKDHEKMREKGEGNE